MPQSTITREDGEGPDEEPTTTDPRQLVLPYVDTAIDVLGGRLPFKVSIAAAFLALPSILALFAGVWYAIQGSPMLGIALLIASVITGMFAVAGRMTSIWSVYPHERVLDAAHHAHRRISLPWGYTEAVDHAADLHAVDQCITVAVGESNPTTYAGMHTHDGRAVVPVRLVGSNTEFLRKGELAQIAGTLTQGIDSEITEDGDAIAFYATTRPASSSAAREYTARASHPQDTRLSSYLTGLLGDVGEWVAERDKETGANETQHYLMITATEDSAGDRDLSEILSRRVNQAENALDASASIEGEPISTREALNLSAEYWGQQPYPPGDVGEAATEAAVPSQDVSDIPEEKPGTTAAERALAPEWFDERSRHVEVGDTVARTYWISNWPEQPPVKFLHGLYTMPGVDLDIKLYGHPKPREKVVSQLKRQIPRIDAEGMDRAESMNVDSLTIDDDLSAYILAFKLLQEVNTQPWGLSGYVTVRAPDTENLREACERVEKELKSPPSRCTPSSPFGDQHVAFRSTAPFGDDHYGAKGDVRRRATKTHLALGGVFGAALPAATPDASDTGGIRWGRDVTTGQTVQVDPFSQGTAPHLITVGPSGSGKSFSVEQASQEWWLNGDDRTVIYCDTQGGFEDAVEGFGAEHIVIDGKTGINPLDIRPAASHDQAATGGQLNQYRLKVDEATEFFCGILRSHGVDPADYHAMIEQGIEQTYADAGITSDPATHGLESPSPEDLFDTLEDMMQNPREYTFTGEGAETERFAERVAELLTELSGFKEGGKYHNILRETTDGLTPDIDMAYLDMRQLAGQTGGAESVNLQLAVGQVSQLIKQTEGETIFVIDEAHNLLHSPEMVDWLNKAAREWRRYDAALWFVTQSPQEFVRNADDDGEENKRETIVEQCSAIQIMNAPRVSTDTLSEFGLPPHHAETVQDKLVPGSSDEDYSECVLSFQDERGWIRTRVEANPVLAESITFSHRTGETYRGYMRNALDRLDDETERGNVSMGEPDAGQTGTLAADGSGGRSE